MNKSHALVSINECKIKASILLKSLHSTDVTICQKSAKRLQRLPEFSQSSCEFIQLHAKRKHALNAIALEKRFNSWLELKWQLPLICGGFLNHWFANYLEAKSYQQLHDGYLFPYQKQFFICDSHYIRQLGFEINDPDWKLIHYDWVNPNDFAAAKRLQYKWLSICEVKNAKI